MNLWIRSQDGNLLEKAEAIKIANYDGTIGIVINNDYVFGEYKTKERAIEVLDEIHKCIIDKEVLHACNNLLTLINKSSLNDTKKIIDRIEEIVVYQMPKN